MTSIHPRVRCFKDGKPPLDAARRNGHADVVAFFLERIGIAPTSGPCCMPSDAQECANCGSPANPHLGPAGTLRACGQCRLVSYCDKPCQVQHWKLSHKQLCVSLGARSVQTALRLRTPAPPRGSTLCVICLEPLASAAVRALRCGHQLHAPCVEAMGRAGGGVSACPLCRRECDITSTDDGVYGAAMPGTAITGAGDGAGL